MKVEVSTAIEELKRQFGTAAFTVREDGQGGAYVLMEPVEIGERFRPASTWLGFQITAQYPYADIYPVFMGADVARADGVAFQAPVTPGHNFEGGEPSRFPGVVQRHKAARKKPSERY